MADRIGLAELLGSGIRGVSRYTGTVLMVFVVQSVVAAACTIGVAGVLSQAFSHLPMFDDAVDGDLVALIWCLRHARPSWFAIAGLVFGAIVLWQIASWFLVGGLNGVLAERPEGRGEAARCFGANGAATYLAYARLALCSLPGLAIALLLLGLGVGAVAGRLEYALTVPQLVGPLVLAILPSLLVLHVVWTISDYARAELTLRHDTHDPGVIVTYLRSIGYVLRRPVTLLHSGFGWILLGSVTACYAYLSYGHPMYGAGGAVTLFVVRQGVSLVRIALRFAIMGGQIELARTRPLPPRRIETRTDSHGTTYP